MKLKPTMGHRRRKYTLDLFNADLFCICAEPKAKIYPSSQQCENGSYRNRQQSFFATWKPRNVKDGPTVVDCIRVPVRVETTERPRRAYTRTHVVINKSSRRQYCRSRSHRMGH